MALGVKPQPTRDREGADSAFIERVRLEAALQAFYDYRNSIYGSPEDRRLRLQQRLIAASDTNCGIFGQQLYATQATVNATFGSLATAITGAGSIVSDVGSARLLSGLGSVTTGVRAEVNEDFFRHMWVEALLKAIETDRDQRRTDMAAHASESISAYPVEAAIADAIRYNNACSLVSGLKLVNQAVVIADDPAGMKAFRDAYSRAGFNAQFVVNASSATKSDRLSEPPATTAAASAALQEISAAISNARIVEADAEGRIDKLGIPAPQASAAKAQLKGILGRATAGDATNLVAPYQTQLTALQTAYATGLGNLAQAGTASARADILSQVRTNDASADVIRRAALQLINDSINQMNDVVSQNTPVTSAAAK